MAIPLIKGKPISGKPLGIIFICIGVGILIIGFPNIKFSKESSHWPTTTGVVVLSEIKEYQSNRTDNFSGTSIPFSLVFGFLDILGFWILASKANTSCSSIESILAV